MAILHNLCWTPMRLVSFEENQSLKIPYHELYKVEAELSMWYYIYYISKRVSMMRDGFRFFWLLLLPKVKFVVELQFPKMNITFLKIRLKRTLAHDAVLIHRNENYFKIWLKFSAFSWKTNFDHWSTVHIYFFPNWHQNFAMSQQKWGIFEIHSQFLRSEIHLIFLKMIFS